MSYYQYYEQGTTYLLGIDHEKKQFSLGSFEGKPESNTRFIEIDQTAYTDLIRKLDRTYQCIDNNLKIETQDLMAKKSGLDDVIADAEKQGKNQCSGEKTSGQKIERE